MVGGSGQSSSQISMRNSLAIAHIEVDDRRNKGLRLERIFLDMSDYTWRMAFPAVRQSPKHFPLESVDERSLDFDFLVQGCCFLIGSNSRVGVAVVG